MASPVEDYSIFEIREFELPCQVGKLPERAGPVLAQILRAEPEALSGQETADSLSYRIAYGLNDIALIDWNAAISSTRTRTTCARSSNSPTWSSSSFRFLDYAGRIA